MALVDARLAEGVSLADQAKAIGLDTAASLESAYRYDRSRVPKRPVMEKAAAYYGVELWQIYGPRPVKDDELTLARKSVAHLLGEDALAKLTDDQVLNAYRVGMAAAKAVLS